MLKRVKLSLIVLSAVFASSCNTQNDSGRDVLQSKHVRQVDKSVELKDFTVETRWISQPIDHTNPAGETFDQQIIVLKPRGVKNDAPVFFMLGNETDSTEQKLIALYENYGAPEDFIFVTADHRGYGQSISKSDQTVPEYVKIDQVLTDYKQLYGQLQPEFSGPWVGAGYSYGGSLVINFADKYPGVFDVILSSSAPTRYDFTFEEYAHHAEKLLGPELSANFKRHFENLKPETLYEENWRSREHMAAMVVGLSQMQAIQPLRPLVEDLAKQSTSDFVTSLRSDLPDGVFELLDSWASLREPKQITADMAKTGSYNWYTWKYQQCTEVGTFFVGDIFPYAVDDHVKDCMATFGEEPEYLTSGKWDVADMLSRVRDPIIIVSGGKDPWLGVGVEPDHTYKNIDYQFFPEGRHCPDRYEQEAGRAVFARVREHLSHQ